MLKHKDAMMLNVKPHELRNYATEKMIADTIETCFQSQYDILKEMDESNESNDAKITNSYFLAYFTKFLMR